ncbi:MAG: GntR family transcriptional regulator [Alphaproteobacteria bacterium]
MEHEPAAATTGPDKTDTLHEQVYRNLREAIMLGRFQPGQALTIRGLSETLGTSMMPAREALRRLVAERALDLLANRRVTVPSVTPQAFAELVEARVALESLAARQAFPFVDDALADRMEDIDLQQDAAIEARDWAAYQERNFAFHFALYAHAPGDVLVPLIESLWLRLGPFLHLTRQNLGRTYLVDRHKEAVAAIRKRDCDALVQAIEQDIRDGMANLPKLADGNGRADSGPTVA